LSARGETTSLDGWFAVSWDDDADGSSYRRYQIEELDTGYRYVARWDDGWRIAPRSTPTVDHERLVGDTTGPISPEYADLDGLLATLNLVSGRSV